METLNTSEKKEYKLSFDGSGSEYFGIVIVNWLLTAITLGIYYPWAKANQLKYLYGATSLNDDRFAFHGTGKEMFKGFIKAIILFIVVYGIFFWLISMRMPVAAILFLYAAILGIIPIAIHGSYRYRMSRTSWRGIRFGYRGNRKELFINFFKWIFFTVITFGIYGAWLSINLRKYLLGNVRLGNMSLNYKGKGADYFVLNLKGYFLSIITLGIYIFWWQKNLFGYYINNLSAEKDGNEIKFKSTATAGDFFNLIMVNLLILVFTLGIGYAWVVTRSMNFLMNKIEMEGDIDLDSLAQTEDVYTDATGEDVGDMLNLDLVT